MTYAWEKPIRRDEPKAVATVSELTREDELVVAAVLKAGVKGRAPTLLEIADAAGCRSVTVNAKKVWAHRRLQKQEVQRALVGLSRNIMRVAMPAIAARLVQTALEDKSGMARNVAAQMIAERVGLKPLTEEPDREEPEYVVTGLENVPWQLRPRGDRDS